MKLNPCVVAAAIVAIFSQAAVAVSPNPDEMAAARQWAAARV